jgi:anthranilate/para-aminobenzoate synthase component I
MHLCFYSMPATVQSMPPVNIPTFRKVGSALWRPIELTDTVPDVAARLAGRPGFLWLDSAVAVPGSISLLAAEPTSLLRGKIGSDWDTVEAALAAGGTGGIYGWVGFDGRFTLGRYPSLLRYDHDTRKWWGQGDFDSWLSDQSPAPKQVIRNLCFNPRSSREVFTQTVHQAQEYIRAGDIYQVNLSHPWHAEWTADADFFGMYLRLREVSPAPHSACLNLDGMTILSASPELFLKMEGRSIKTRPIKGTRPRFPRDSIRDAQSAHDLLMCEKERAELLMITDLERNDLGQVCEYGSVCTNELWKVETFAQVYHLVSTVTGTLKKDVSHAAAFRACFPGGSISGAPKKRALEIISELEPWPRGIYTGAIGGFGLDDSCQWSIAIRTAVRCGPEVTFHTGSGIVADSIPEREWEETLHKASGLLNAWGKA